MKKELKEAFVFLGLTIVLSYFVFWGPIALLKIPTANLVEGQAGPTWAITLFMIGGFVPSILGISLTGIFEGKDAVRRLFRSSHKVNFGLKYYVYILAVPLFIVSSLIAIYTLLDGKFDFRQFYLQGTTLVPLIVVGPLSEEFGWRGFAIKRLLHNLSPNLTSLILGLTWSLWHLPLFYIVGSSQYEFNLPFLPFLITITSISFAFTYFYLKTGGSIFSAIFFHWVFTYAIQVVNSSVARTGLYNWLEFVPALLVGLGFAFIMYRERDKERVLE